MAATGSVERWIVAPGPGAQTRLHLFCLPYAGGGASIFHTWARGLSPQVAVHAIQPPGREGRIAEPPFTRLEPLIQALAAAMLPYLGQPFALFGHSMGALLSFELARYLRRRHGLTPAQMFVSAHRAPHLPNPEPEIYRLPEEAFVERLRRMRGTREEVLANPELMALVLPTLRADFAVCGTYAYRDEPPLTCPISAFVGLQDTIASHAQVAAWGELTSGPFSLRAVPGNHFFLHSAQALLLWTIDQSLRQLLGDAERPVNHGRD